MLDIPIGSRVADITRQASAAGLKNAQTIYAQSETTVRGFADLFGGRSAVALIE